MKWPFGNSNSHASSSSKPSLRQIAFDGALSTFGKACMKRCLSSRLASSIACAFASPEPRPGRRPRDSAALELRHDHPADLVDLLAAPLLRPAADRADAG